MRGGGQGQLPQAGECWICESGADSRTVSNDSVFAESPVLLNARRLELDVCCLEMVLLHSVAGSRCLLSLQLSI